MRYDENRLRGRGAVSPHAFRRGATQGIKDSGPTLPDIIKSGNWTRSGYWPYLGIQAAFSIDIARFTLDAIGSDSEDEDESMPKNDRLVRIRMGGIPISLAPVQ